MLKIFDRIFGITKRKEEAERRKKQQEDVERALLEKRKRETVEKILRFPEKEMTQDEVNALPRFDEIRWRDLPYGSWFFFMESVHVPGLILLGHRVVKDDLFCEQIGARTSDFDSVFNRYRLKLV